MEEAIGTPLKEKVDDRDISEPGDETTDAQKSLAPVFMKATPAKQIKASSRLSKLDKRKPSPRSKTSPKNK